MSFDHAVRAALCAAVLANPVAALAASSPKGVWINDTGRGAIEIASCGAALCGHVVWVKDASDKKGCGRQIIGELTPSGSSWDNGWIYSPEKKRRYDVEVTPLSDGRLRVVGYAGTKLFSKTMIWTRAPADLKRCGDEVASKTVTVAQTTSAVAASKPEPPAPSSAPQVSAAGSKTPAVPSHDAMPAPVPPSATASAKPSQPAPPAAQSDTPAAPAVSAPKAATAAPQPAASDATAPGHEDTAANAGDDDLSDDPANAPKASAGGLNLGDIDLDKILKRTSDGRCKLDLPFVKVQFNCER